MPLKTSQKGPLCLFGQNLHPSTIFVSFLSNIAPMSSMSRMYPVLMVVALLMLLQLWLYNYGVNTNGVTVINSPYYFKHISHLQWSSRIAQIVRIMKMKKLLKVYVVCMKLTVGLLLHLEKISILERLNQLVMTKLKFCVWRGLVEHQIALFDQRVKI